MVEQELTKFILSIDSGGYINAPKKSFEKYAEDWLALIQNDITVTTWENYERQLINHIIPYFAKKQIDKIAAINVKQFYKHLLTNDVRLDGKKGPLSARSVKDIHGILNKMFTDAKEWELLEKNILENVKPPAVGNSEAKIYENDKDILDMIVALLKEPLQKQILFLTAMSASMRRGELVGIDFNNVFLKKTK